jgi:DNA-binding IclR family transcriptional regulator
LLLLSDAADSNIQRNFENDFHIVKMRGGNVPQDAEKIAELGEGRKFASTLARGLSILRAFRAGDSGLTHSELVERTGLAGATVTRLAYTLAALGYLSHGGKNQFYRLGPAAVALGNVAQASVSFFDLASDAMQELANRTGTLSLIAVRDGMRMMLVKTWRPVDTPSIWLEPGHRVPVYGSSSGQAALAALSDARFLTLDGASGLREFRQDGYEQLVAKGFTITPDALRYAATVNSVSVPLFATEFGEPVAFTCGATPEMLSRARMTEEVGPALRDLVRQLEQRTGRSSALSYRD